MAKYPNVKVERIAKSFEDTVKTVKLAASDPDAPDIVPANQGRPIMGELVKAKLLRPITDYAKVYGWEDRYSSTLLDLNKFSPDGKEFGSGELYGLSQMGEIVGVFYNKEKVADAADDAGRVRGVAARGQGRGRDADPVRQPRRSGRASTTSRACSGRRPTSRRSATSCSRRRARRSTRRSSRPRATKIQEWVDKGYFNKNFNGIDYDAAWADVREGREPLPDRRHVARRPTSRRRWATTSASC